jgi:DNA (cytosine-5)-methyltransferase 1
MSLVTGPWTLADLRDGKVGFNRNGLKVFSCFHCGGGSSMGYKLAGFDVLGGVEIDPEMMGAYRSNLKPEEKFSFMYPVQDFKVMADKLLPPELFDLDILDGSPPCSSFSMAGSREDAWGKSKKFREGQANQVLDDLFFHFIDIAKKLQPKVVVAENVKGLLMGNAKGYCKMIFDAFRRAGYETQLFLLNSSRMGVPQSRERTFFIARRTDLKMPKVELKFTEEPISISKALAGVPEDEEEQYGASMKARWTNAPRGGYSKTKEGNTFGFVYKLHPDLPSATITASPRVYHWKVCRRLNAAEVIRAQSFPEDYNFMKEGNDHANYICGMSVPPLMMQRLAHELHKQLFGLKKTVIRKNGIRL